MKMYKYSFAEDCTASLEVIEVQECSDSYIDKSGIWQITNKEDIGKALHGYRDTVVCLLEPDFEKARTSYLADMQRTILRKKEELAKLYDNYQKICDLEAI